MKVQDKPTAGENLERIWSEIGAKVQDFLSPWEAISLAQRNAQTRCTACWQGGYVRPAPLLKQMTTKAKKILITTESRERWIVRRGCEKSRRGFCPRCAAEVELLPLDAAVSVSGKSTRELLYQTETGAVHVIETTSGHLLVCQNWLNAT